jgi:hypothetical protein
MPLNAENQEHIRRLRGADGPKVTFSGTPAAEVELYHVFWSGTGGNIVLIVPAGSEAIRELGVPASQESAANKRQPEVELACSDASIDMQAPNGAHVATLILAGQHGQVRLSKNEHITAQIGMFRLATINENLMPKHRFELPPLSLRCVPSIATLSPREWSFRISAAYDGK